MSQSQLILNHLKKAPITPIEALEQYGCFRLAARIKDLREQGYKIQTKAKILRNGKIVAQYMMENTDE